MEVKDLIQVLASYDADMEVKIEVEARELPIRVLVDAEKDEVVDSFLSTNQKATGFSVGNNKDIDGNVYVEIKAILTNKESEEI